MFWTQFKFSEYIVKLAILHAIAKFADLSCR